jgi:Carboxypeptidase regulatory-like domain
MNLILPISIVLVCLAAQQPRDVRPALKLGTAALAGNVVTDDDGKPIRRVTIVVMGTDDPQMRFTMTDDAGRFVMPALPAGRYLVSASKPPFVDAVFGARLPGRPGTSIVLKEGDRRDNMQIKMVRGGAITGTVTDELGQPAVGVYVDLVQSRSRTGDRMMLDFVSMVSTMLIPRQTTDDRGVYRFSGLPPGDYIVSATPTNAAAGDAVVLTNEEVTSAAREAGQAPRPAVAGQARVPASTVVGPEQRAPRPTQMVASFMEFGSSGRSGGPGMPSGGSTIGYTPVFYPGTTNASDAQVIAIAPGDERIGIDIVARPVPTTRIDGIVIGPDGQPTRGVSVSVRSEDRAETFLTLFASLSRTVQTQPDGVFTLSGVPPGRYTIQARTQPAPFQPGGAANPATPAPATGLWAAAEVIADGRPITGVSLTLQTGLTISGRVSVDSLSKDTSPDMNAVMVVMQPARATDLLSMRGGTGRVSPDGTFTITGLVPGTYRLVGTSMPQGPVMAWMDVSVRVGGREVSDLPFELRPGENHSDVAITLTNRQQSVSGTLQEASGIPATEYTMVLFPADKAYWLPDSRRIMIARPGTDGRFAFRGLQWPPPGDYLLAAVTDIRPSEQFDPVFLDALAKQAIKLTLAPGEAKVQDVKLVR